LLIRITVIMLNATFHILYIYAIYVFIRPRQVGAITLGIKRVDIGLRFHGGQWPTEQARFRADQA